MLVITVFGTHKIRFYPGTYVDEPNNQCHPCEFCGTGKQVSTDCSNTADTTCADRLCPAVQAVPHAVVALMTCDKFQQCDNGEAAQSGTGCSGPECGTREWLPECGTRADPAIQPVCGLYGAQASVACAGLGWQKQNLSLSKRQIK